MHRTFNLPAERDVSIRFERDPGRDTFFLQRFHFRDGFIGFNLGVLSGSVLFGAQRRDDRLNQEYLAGVETRLRRVLPGLKLARSGGAITGFGAAPVLIEGSARGIESFSFQFRENTASLRTSLDGPAKLRSGSVHDVYPGPYTEHFNSFEFTDDLVECFSRCVAALADVSPDNPAHPIRMAPAIEEVE